MMVIVMVIGHDEIVRIDQNEKKEDGVTRVE